MTPNVLSFPPMRSLSTIAPEIVGRATCPLCHTVDPTMTNIALSAGTDWHCSRCGQRWDTMRLAAVAGYAVWLSARTDASDNHDHDDGDPRAVGPFDEHFRVARFR